jgi:hypothetical protein
MACFVLNIPNSAVLVLKLAEVLFLFVFIRVHSWPSKPLCTGHIQILNRFVTFVPVKNVYIPHRINKSPSNPAAAPLPRGLFSGMSTERQKNASRVNGSKSHGPVTAFGKLASSRNAITHGMLSTTIVLNGESTDRFLGLLATLFEEFQPQTPFEESLIENMAVARWRQMRIWGMEKAGMEHEMRRQAEMSNSTGLDASEHAATRASIAFRTLSDDSRSLELINRYDSRYDRQYYRAHRRFVETRDRRAPPAPLPPQPVPACPPPASPQADPEIVVSPLKPKPSVPEKVVISKRTRQVAANKTAQAQVRCAADADNPMARKHRRNRRGYGDARKRAVAQRPVPLPQVSSTRGGRSVFRTRRVRAIV